MSDEQNAQSPGVTLAASEEPAGLSPGVQEPQGPLDDVPWRDVAEGQSAELVDELEELDEVQDERPAAASSTSAVAGAPNGHRPPGTTQERAVPKPTPPPIPVVTADMLTAAAEAAARTSTQPLMQAVSSASGGVDDDVDPDLAALMNDIVSSEQKKRNKSGGGGVRRARPARPWYEDVFDASWLQTLPDGFHAHTLRETDFLMASLGLDHGARVLDVGCGFGRHAVLMAERGFDMVGLDLSMELLEKGLAEAQRRSLSIKFIHGDMRDLNFDRVFDGACCLNTTFGFFDDRTNYEVLEGIARSVKLGGRIVIETINRDWILDRVPRRVWWEGGDYLFLEDIEFDFETSRLRVERTVVDETDDPHKQRIEIRCYSLHEMHTLLRLCGFEVLESSGDYVTRNAFLGTSSRHVIVTAERVS